jgi:hypothetical protein
LVEPAPLSTVSVQVCVAAGVFTEEPLAPPNVPLPKLPVQTKGICASASFVDVHEMVEFAPVVMLAGANEAVQVGGGVTPVPDKLTVVGVPATPPVFDVTVKLPLKLPRLVGENLMVIVQVPLGAIERLFVHVVETLVKGTAGVVRVGLPSTRFEPPTFFTVMVELRKLPTATDPKASGFGVMLIQGKEFPVRLIVNDGVFAAFEVMIKLPLKVPADTGANLIETVHLELGVSVPPLVHVAAVLEKGATGLPTVPRIRFVVPVFCTVTSSVELPPTTTEPKASGLGVAVMVGLLAVPVTGTLTVGLFVAFEGIVKLVGKVPLAVGTNVTEIVHVAFSARVCPEQVSVLIVYGAASGVTVPIIRAPAAVFWTVTESVVVEFTATVPKSRDAGVTVIFGSKIVTVAEHILVPLAPLSTVRVQV